MGKLPRSKPTRFRRAIAGSVAVHLMLVSAGTVAFRVGSSSSKPTQPGFDTRADEPKLRLLPEEIAIAVPEPEPHRQPDPVPPDPVPLDPVPPDPVPPERPPDPVPKSEPAAGSTTLARPPVKNFVPNTLPAEVLALLRRPTPVPQRVDPNVRPASAVNLPSRAPAIHGAMKSGQSIVYVLDCSGSMGEFGKLAIARAALVSTLQRQSADVRFQVFTYNGAARSVFPGICVAATPANIATAEAGLANLKAAGRSNHVEAVRAAVGLRPDVIVVLTDAPDLTLAAFKSVLVGVGKSLPVCVANVSADGVTPPRELK